MSNKLLRLDQARWDRASEAVYQHMTRRTPGAAPWDDIKRRARFDTAAYGELATYQDIARVVLEAYADRKDPRWIGR